MNIGSRSFAFRLNFVLCSLCLVGIFSTILISSTLSHLALEQEVRDRSMPALARSIENEITEALSVVHSSLRYVAQLPMLIQWMEQGEPKELLLEIVELATTYTRVFKTGYLNLTVDSTRHFYEAVGGPDQENKTLDPVVDRWFDDFKASGMPVQTNLHAPEDSRYGGMTYVNARVSDASGRFLGIVSVPVGMDDFARSLESKKIGRLGSTFIVLANGLVRMHSTPSLVHRRLEELPGFQGGAARTLASGTSFFTTEDARGRRLLVGIRPLAAMNAFVVTVADEAELFRDITNARNVSLLAALGVLCLILYAGNRFGGNVTNSLRRVVDFAGKVADNQALEPFEPGDGKELRELAEALNAMSGQLRRTNLSLEAVGRIFDGLDTMLMVTEPATDRILFSNAGLNRELHHSDDPRGSECWRVMFPEQESRCADCPLEELLASPGRPVRRRVRSAATGRLYDEIHSLIDWTDQSKAMLIQRLDVTEAAEARKALRLRLAQQTLAVSITQSLFSDEPIANLVAGAVDRAGRFMGHSRLRLSRHDQAHGVLVCEYEWRNPGTNPPALLGTVMAFDDGRPAHTRYVRGKKTYTQVSDTADAPDLVLMPDAGIRAFIDVPIYVSGKLWGIIGVDDCQGPRQWSKDDVHIVRIIAGILSGLLFRKVTEKRLLRMGSLIEEATLYITYVNRHGEFQYFNRSTGALLGYTPEELYSRGLAAFFSEKTMELARSTLIPAIIEKGRLSFELPVQRKDGAIRFFTFEAFAIGSGDEVGIGAIGLDVTEKRRLQSELLTAKEEAEQSSRAKSAFLSRMSHEMRTPLNAIMGMVGIAQRTDKEERARHCLRKINEAATHLLEMINEILEMSNIEAGGFVLREERFVVADMLGNVLDHIRPRAAAKRQHLTLEQDPAIPDSLHADKRHCIRALKCLLDNAVKFTPDKGRIHLKTRLADETDRDCLLEIVVSDNGVGIPADKVNLLFKPFEQVDGGNARLFGGAGLSLALSRTILERMGGGIEYAAGQDGGSRFTLRLRAAKHPPGPDETARALPAAPPKVWPDAGPHVGPDAGPHVGQDVGPHVGQDRAEPEQAEDFAAPEQTEEAGAAEQTEEAAPADKTAAPAARPPDGAYAGRHVLLVEDMEVNREIVTALLEPTGLIIDCAENGREAVRMFLAAPERYQLIFMDINMPEVNGYDATTAIRASKAPHASDIPIIAMTANTFEQDVRQCLAVGMNGHLAKPIMADRLLAVLEAYLLPGNAPKATPGSPA